MCEQIVTHLTCELCLWLWFGMTQANTKN